MESTAHILYVDDDADTCELMRLLLESAGLGVTVVEDATAALQLLNKQKYDAVVLDNWMPEITGVDLCRQIREFDSSTPIIFCSGVATDADRREALYAGAQCYFEKPVEPDELILALRENLKTATTPRLLKSEAEVAKRKSAR